MAHKNLGAGEIGGGGYGNMPSPFVQMPHLLTAKRYLVPSNELGTT